MWKLNHYKTLFAVACIKVDGSNNPCIQSVFLESFPIYTAHFSQNGHEVILASRHSAFYCYDMMAGKVSNIPRIKGKSTYIICTSTYISAYLVTDLLSTFLLHLMRAFIYDVVAIVVVTVINGLFNKSQSYIWSLFNLLYNFVLTDGKKNLTDYWLCFLSLML